VLRCLTSTFPLRPSMCQQRGYILKQLQTIDQAMKRLSDGKQSTTVVLL
jgi:hypothetical protein